MRFLIAFIGMVVLAWLAGLVMPWWSVAAAAFLISLLLPQKPFTGFICAFLAVFLLWFLLAFSIDLQNDHILAGRMAILVFKKDASLAIIVMSAAIGGFVAGMASLSACLLRYRKQIRGYGESR